MDNAAPANNKRIWMIGFSAAFLVLIIALTVIFWPQISRLTVPEFWLYWIDDIRNLGFWGIFIMLLIQMVQIVIAIIPGEPVEIMAGALYGPWGGLAICLVGIALASSLVFFVVRKFGEPLISRLFKRKKLEEFRFFKTAERIQLVTFLLFLIPGTPKDMLTYVAGATRIKPSTFLIIATFARIPSVISSTLMGAQMESNNWKVVTIIFVITAMIGVLGILFNQKIMDKIKKLRH